MPARDKLRLIIHDIGEQQRFTNSQLDEFLDLALMELNGLNSGSTYELADFDTPTLVPSWFQLLTLKRAHIQIVFAEFTAPKHFKKMITQDAQVDPGDGASRVKKLLDVLIAEYDKIAAYYLPLPNAGVLGLLINYSGEIGSESLISS